MPDHPITRLPPACRDRIAAQVAACSIPLLWTDGAQRLAVRGTGVLFRTALGCYLITAGHVLNGVDLAQLAVPARPSNGPLLSLRHAQPRISDEDRDLAAIPLAHQNSPLESLAGSWQVLDQRALLGDDGLGDRGCLVAGFPNAHSELRLHRDGVATGPITQLYTWAYRGPVLGASAADDFFLEYGRQGRDDQDRPIATPELEGISGAPVWAVTSWPGASPRLRLAGVQTSYLHSRYLRCKHWSAVHSFLARIESEPLETARRRHSGP